VAPLSRPGLRGAWGSESAYPGRGCIPYFTDGIIIAAAFLTSLPLGISSSVSITAHEVPVGDFAILLDGGYSRGRAYLYNMISSLSTLPGAIVIYLFLGEIRIAPPYLLALSAASFLYIAIADLLPGLHKQISLAHSVRQFLLMLAGIGTIAIFHHG